MANSSAFDSDLSKPPPRSQLQLVVHAGPLAGKGYPIRGESLTFGRDPNNDITLDDSQVSRYHARLLIHGDQIVLEDLGSTNGTLVNGKPISEQHILQPADIISIGTSVFGVKGFAAPNTLGVTQVSREKPTFLDIPSSRPPSDPSPPVRVRKPSPPVPAQPAKAESSGLSMLAIGGILALIIVILIIAGVTAFILSRDGGSTAVSEGPNVVITAPVNGSQVPLNVSQTIQATASDPTGVVRMELWVRGEKTAESISPVEEGQPTLTASFQWTPKASGSYTLEIRAYNRRGTVSSPTVITVNTIGDGPTDTPTPTGSPDTPTATVPSVPSLTTQTDLNVRSGPSLDFDLLGLLPTGTTAEILGRSQDGQWWQIRFDPAFDDVGWVSSDPAFSRASNVETLPIIASPPTPTPIPSSTATDTPTATATVIPSATPTVTDTPTPTNTPTSTTEPTDIEFNVSPTSIQGGECVNVSWNVTGVREIYFQGDGVAGSANLVDCPKEDETYRLRVVKLDGSEQTEEREVDVINPISSAGTINVDANDTVDFDDGRIPGNDFKWNFDGGNRRFEALSGVQLAPMEDTSSLDSLSLAECAGANFGQYSYIDGSDGAPDEINKLVDGRSACYRTNEGRLGKLRFPDRSSGSIDVEWLTWR